VLAHAFQCAGQALLHSTGVHPQTLRDFLLLTVIKVAHDEDALIYERLEVRVERFRVWGVHGEHVVGRAFPGGAASIGTAGIERQRKIPPFDACFVSSTATEGPGFMKFPSDRRPSHHGKERKFAAPFNAESRFRWRFCPWFASA
jgi:hypothetical protein